MGTPRRPDLSGESDECSMTAFQRVGVTAEVTITPTVECGPLTVTCLDTRVVRDGWRKGDGWEFRKHGRCRLVLFQELCVAVPVTFGAHAACRLEQVFCGPASTDPFVCLSDESFDTSRSGSDSAAGSESGSRFGSSGSSGSDAEFESGSDTGESDSDMD